MLSIEWITALGLGYLLVLFLIAYFGDVEAKWLPVRYNSNVVYALSLAVYCSSWTFYGAVGTASVRGWDYLAIYFGPCLVFLFGYPLMRRIILICKQNRITTISDFIASRFAKSRRIGGLVTLVAVIGSLPYIALQLHAVSQSYLVLQGNEANHFVGAVSLNADAIAFYVGVILVIFSILFGTRHLDASEHHRGMVLAVAFESVVKLLAILAVGYYAVFLLLGGASDALIGQQEMRSAGASLMQGESNWLSFLTRTFLAMGAIVLLPRQFQVAIVESENHQQFRTAIWLMPIYLLLTSVIVLPIALAGSVLLPGGNEDMYVLNLPMLGGNQALSLLAFIGGLSAATGMVIVAVISLSTMVCNDWIMPHLIRLKSFDLLASGNLERVILSVRRLAIVFLLAVAYGYYLLMDENEQLANIGLVSFAAVAQFLPAVLAALFWQRAHSTGIFWGLVAGFIAWIYTLFLPTVLPSGFIDQLLGQNAWMHPEHLMGLGFGDALTHGVFWSLLVNCVILIVVSFKQTQSTLESMQANRFYNIDKLAQSPSLGEISEPMMVHPDALRILAERVIGVKNTDKIFAEYESRTGNRVAEESQLDGRLLSLVQTAIAGVIGTASAQRVIADAITGNEEYLQEVTTLVDASSGFLKFNRKLLETTLQNITHGISVVDADLNLVVWNDRYIELFDYPENLIYIGKPVEEVLRYNASRGDFAGKDANTEIRRRLRYLEKSEPYQNTRQRANGVVIKSTGEPMPGGGFVTTYEDITQTVKASQMLVKANEELESRVRQRTHELEVLTEELERNTRSKTHFLAAASHDLLQPINAARLFTQSAAERVDQPEEVARLTENIDESLQTANQLLRALLDVSKLDAGGIEPDYSVFSLHEFVRGLVRELDPVAFDADVILEFDLPELWVRSDRQLLLSIMQNLVTNAIRYTPPTGRVWVHSKSDDLGVVYLSVSDTGTGMDKQHLDKIFNEFYQVKSSDNRHAKGLGLGLSIVKRICRLLGSKVSVTSSKGKGTTFTVTLPEARAPENQAQNNKSALPRSTGHDLRGLKVLCIDNDEAVLNAMQTLLSGWGCDLDCVTGYSQALELLDQKSYELILADYRLDDEETGLDILQIARRKADDLLGTVLITAEQNTDLKDQVIDSGHYYLAKPVEPAALKSTILYILSSQREAT